MKNNDFLYLITDDSNIYVNINHIIKIEVVKTKYKIYLTNGNSHMIEKHHAKQLINLIGNYYEH